MAKTVIVSCGTAIATSTVVAKAIEEACKAEGIAVHTKQCKAAEIARYVEEGADLIVTTSQIRYDPGIPVIQGLAFLTGVGKDQVLEEILGYLRD
jgi:PTS system galactitol-specific IIB component